MSFPFPPSPIPGWRFAPPPQGGFVEESDLEGYTDLLTRLNRGYVYAEPIIYTADDVFVPPAGLLAVIFELQAGGGSGSGCAACSVASQVAVGGGGYGGEWVRGFVLASDLDPTGEAITVGAGGAAPTAGANDGNTGEDSVVDTISGELRAKGGLGGTERIAPGTGAPLMQCQQSAAPAGGVGDIEIPGGSPGIIYRLGNDVGGGAHGGDSFWGHGGRDHGQANVGNGEAGRGYGGGGAGGYDRNSGGNANRSGGAGSDGLVVAHPLF